MVLKKVAMSVACVVSLFANSSSYAKDFIDFEQKIIQAPTIEQIAIKDTFMEHYKDISNGLIDSLKIGCFILSLATTKIEDKDKAEANTFKTLINLTIKEAERRLKTDLAKNNDEFRTITENVYYALQATKTLLEYKINPRLNSVINGIGTDILFDRNFDFISFGKELVSIERELMC